MGAKPVAWVDRCWCPRWWPSVTTPVLMPIAPSVGVCSLVGALRTAYLACYTHFAHRLASPGPMPWVRGIMDRTSPLGVFHILCPNPSTFFHMLHYIRAWSTVTDSVFADRTLHVAPE